MKTYSNEIQTTKYQNRKMLCINKRSYFPHLERQNTSNSNKSRNSVFKTSSYNKK